jgi:hypothetical protein
MIQLDYESFDYQNIYAGAVTALTHTLPVLPDEHMAAACVGVSLLAPSVSRSLTVSLLMGGQEVFRASVLFTSGASYNSRCRWLAVPLVPLFGGCEITMTIQSDNPGDTAVHLSAHLSSHDLNYWFALHPPAAGGVARV